MTSAQDHPYVVSEIPSDRDYWFIRTDGGENFEEFFEGNYIAIGWDEITTDDIETKTVLEIKTKIATVMGLDNGNRRDKGKITSIYNKIMRFAQLKYGDLIIIPSPSSFQLAFGLIDDYQIYEDFGTTESYQYLKRRNVKWLTKELLGQLHPSFYQIIFSRHAISNVNGYSTLINSVTETLYIQNETTHYILDIKKEENIDFSTLATFLETLDSLLNDIQTTFELGAEQPISITLNLNSPGKIEFKGALSKALVILATMLASCAGGDYDNLTPEQLTFVKVNQEKLDKADSCIRQLQVDVEKLKRIK